MVLVGRVLGKERGVFSEVCGVGTGWPWKVEVKEGVD